MGLDCQTPFQHHTVTFAVIHSRQSQEPKIGISDCGPRFGDLTAEPFHLDPRLGNLDFSDVSRAHALSVDPIHPLKTGQCLILAGQLLVRGQCLDPCLGRFLDQVSRK